MPNESEIEKLKHELDEARREVHLINLDRNEAVNDLSKSNERIAILEKECQQNNQAACLFDRDAALAELAKVREELELVLKQRDQLGHLLTGGSLTEQQVIESGLGVGVLIEKRHAEAQRDLLAKHSHEMRGVIRSMPALSGGRHEADCDWISGSGQYCDCGWNDLRDAIANLSGLDQQPDTHSLTVLTRAEVEKLPCNCSGVFAKEGDYKCPRCLLLERFTK